ncbi:hypothetical protein PHMEG_00027612, partial [Phytophthora megakarya]
VNHIEGGEDPGKYAGFESDAGNDDGDDEDDLVETIEPGIAQVPVPPEMRFDASLLSSLGGLGKVAAVAVAYTVLKEMGVSGWSELTTHTLYDYLLEVYEARPPNGMQKDYPRLYTGDSGPTTKALDVASSSSGQHAKQFKRELKHPDFKVKSCDAILEDVLNAAPIEPSELCVFLGLLIARSIAPNKEKLAHHWKMSEKGAISRGCFWRFMTRDRFMHISRNLRFNSNENPRAAKYRAWKLRPLIDALQNRFAAGYTPPNIMAFDDAMLHSRSTFNRMRVYIVDKPQNEARICSCCAAHRRPTAFGEYQVWLRTRL